MNMWLCLVKENAAPRKRVNFRTRMIPWTPVSVYEYVVVVGPFNVFAGEIGQLLDSQFSMNTDARWIIIS